MVTMAGTQNRPDKLVKALLKLEHNALEAYDATIERLETPAYVEKIREFRGDHLDHINKLSRIARILNVEVPDAGGKSMLTKGKVAIAGMVGDDESILRAMKSNEEDTVSAYEHALDHDFLTNDMRAVCEKGLADERRHRAWMAEMSGRA